MTEDAQLEKKLKAFADLVQLYPENETYLRQYAQLLLKTGKQSTATEILRMLHCLLLKNRETDKADALTRHFPQIGRIRKKSHTTQQRIQELLPSSTRNKLWLRLHQRSIKEGVHLIHKGELDDAIYLVCEGELAEFIHGSDGKPVLLNLITAGDVVGEGTLFNPGPHKSDVIANKNSTIARIPHKKILPAIDSDNNLKLALQEKTDLRRLTALISSAPLIQNIPLPLRRDLAEESFVHHYPALTTIHNAGKQLSYVDLIIKGQASYQLKSQQGINELQLLQPGALVGENAAIHDHGCPAELVAITDISMLHIPYTTFKQVVDSFPPLRKALFTHADKQQEKIMHKLNELQTQQLEISKKN